MAGSSFTRSSFRPGPKVGYLQIILTLALSLAVAAPCCRTLRSCRDGSLRVTTVGQFLLLGTGLVLLAAKEIEPSLTAMTGAGLVAALGSAFARAPRLASSS